MAKRPLQISLTTALVMTFVASIFLYLNCEFRFFGGWGYGWPVLCYQPGRGPNFWDCADASSAGADLFVLLFVEIIVLLIVEFILMAIDYRRREGGRRSAKEPHPAAEGPQDSAGAK